MSIQTNAMLFAAALLVLTSSAFAKRGLLQNNARMKSKPSALAKVMEAVRRDPVSKPTGLKYRLNVKRL